MRLPVRATAADPQRAASHGLPGLAGPFRENQEAAISRSLKPHRYAGAGSLVGSCVDAMLEPAVMHPIRHTFQLRNLMREQGLQ